VLLRSEQADCWLAFQWVVNHTASLQAACDKCEVSAAAVIGIQTSSSKCMDGIVAQLISSLFDCDRNSMPVW
jgi:hypothetical protein